MLNGPDFKARPHLAGLRAKDLGQRQQTKIVQQKNFKNKLKLCNKKLWQSCDKDPESKVTRLAADNYNHNWATQTYISKLIYKIYISYLVYETTLNQV